MWLLSRSDNGGYGLSEFYGEDNVPPYAILSHRCLQPDAAEPTFQDLWRGLGQEKPGHKKIEFCGEQAERDGLKYFWVDTCCITRENHNEHQHALRSMFHWYRRSEKCYVYLNDVHSSDTSIIPRSWDSEFYKSSWFTRGWTLQELLAPRSVEFFTCEGAPLGSKILLAEQISEITRIPASALNGRTLSHFSREERFGWSQSRETTIPEDRAYSLLGIFGVDMPIAYGEGAGGAIRRLEEAIERRNICIRDIRLSDPRDDKKRIEEAKGGLLKDAYRWALQTSEFQQWRSTEDSSILWIKGDPGKGKTMLLCGMIEELEKSSGRTPVLSYFFCQATDRRADNATAVLRGLIYMFVHQWTSLVSHFQAKHDTAGKTLFEDVNARVALADILRSMLEDPLLDGAYIVVDALDECSADRDKLLNFIVAASSIRASIKWIVSSRNWSDVEKAFRGAGQAVKLSLELNEDSISAAVTTYIQFKVKELAQRNHYDKVEQEAVQRNLECNARGTFLWVALVCQELLDVDGWEAEELSQEFPPGLEPFYRRMIGQILHSKRSKLCKEVLAVASVVRRPLSLEEMSALISGGPSNRSKPEAWVSIVEDCGSFLTLRNKAISFVHQSAKDFLVHQACSDIFQNAIGHVHHDVCTRSLTLMMKTLRRDIYELEDPGIYIDEVNPPHSSDPLAATRYSCVYWIEHLQESMTIVDKNILRNGGMLDNFLRGYYLYWLEASSLSRSMAEAQVSMSKLETLLQNEVRSLLLSVGQYANFTQAGSELSDLAHDALRFVMYFKVAIEGYPLQTYMSALLFSPKRSMVRNLYTYEGSKQITVVSPVAEQWNACLQTLEGHSDRVNSVVFSHDSTRLASASDDSTVKIWDATNGDCLQTLEGHSDRVKSVVFSHDSTRLASASDDSTVKIWDATNGDCLQTLEGHSDWVNSVVFSHDSTKLASASHDMTIKVWDARNGDCLQTLEGHNVDDLSVLFSQHLSGGGMPEGSQQPQRSLEGSIAISQDRSWVTRNSQKVLWLPSEYRPALYKVSKETVGMGTGSGRVWICRFRAAG